MTETTTPTPTPQELRVTADALEAAEWYATAAQIRSAASALDAQGETTGEKAIREAIEAITDYHIHSELRLHIKGVDKTVRLLEAREALRGLLPAAPPLAPSSDIPWQDAYEVTHVNGQPVKPSSGASVPQMLSVHPSHVMETQRASKMASCVNCDRPLDWPCDANNPREASAPQTEEQIAFTAGWNAAKRDSDAADDEDIADAPDVAFKEVE